MNALVIRKFRSSFMIGVLAVTAIATFSSNNAMAWSLKEAAKPYAGKDEHQHRNTLDGGGSRYLTPLRPRMQDQRWDHDRKRSRLAAGKDQRE